MKIKPSLQKFLQLTKRGNLIPVYMELMADLETPVSSFLKLNPEGPSFLLESVEGGRSQGRYSFVGFNPSRIIRAQGKRISIQSGNQIKTQPFASDPLLSLEKCLKTTHAVTTPDLPRFFGGAVGYMSYDCNRFYEQIPCRKATAKDLPDMFYMITEQLLVFDHLMRKIKIVSNAQIPLGASRMQKKAIYDHAVSQIRKIQTDLNRAHIAEANTGRGRAHHFKSNMSKASFMRGVKRIKQHIRMGEVIQTVLSQRFETSIRCSGFQVYRALRSVNPSPYMFYLNCGDFQLVGSSPETHVRCEDGTLTLKPIAGTRPRGRSQTQDQKLERDLLKDPKERAEHVMLVDLGRNDLGRVSKVGSVEVKDFMTVEQYSHVMHIVSLVSGHIKPNKSLYDVIRATFPAGTVSGAPKVRAMQIISQLEKTRRGPYAGLVGYLSFSGNFDSCITIRTMVIQNGKACIQAGAGIVADSVPEREWMETRNKARGMMKALELAERGLA